MQSSLSNVECRMTYLPKETELVVRDHVASCLGAMPDRVPAVSLVGAATYSAGWRVELARVGLNGKTD